MSPDSAVAGSLADAQLGAFLSLVRERGAASEGVSAKELFDFGSVPASFAGVVSARADSDELAHHGRGGGDPLVLTLRDCYVGSFLEIESGVDGEPWYGQVTRVDSAPGVELPIIVSWLGVAAAKGLPEYLKGAGPLYTFKGGEDGISLESVREARARVGSRLSELAAAPAMSLRN